MMWIGGTACMRVAIQPGMAVNRPIVGDADAIVHRRERKHLNLVVHRLHAFDALHHIPASLFSVGRVTCPISVTVPPSTR